MVVVHLLFVAFALAGGLLVVWRRRAAWLHLPCAVWAALIEYAGWICPLTPLENHLRRLGGEAGYAGGFVETYLLAVLYPEGLTRGVQIALGSLVVVVNVGLYAWAFGRRRGRTDLTPAATAAADATRRRGRRRGP
jgi:hypothetical protein